MVARQGCAVQHVTLKHVYTREAWWVFLQRGGAGQAVLGKLPGRLTQTQQPSTQQSSSTVS